MTYTVAGFTFTFVQNGSGGVYQIITPAIPPLVDTYTLNFDPALTVQGAKDIADGLVALLTGG